MTLQDLNLIPVNSWTDSIKMNKLIAMMAEAEAVSVEADDDDDREGS